MIEPVLQEPRLILTNTRRDKIAFMRITRVFIPEQSTVFNKGKAWTEIIYDRQMFNSL